MHSTKNMANFSGDFLIGEDLEDIFNLLEGSFLENDDDLCQLVNDIAYEVDGDEENIGGFKCSQCDKICKSQRGLTRHINSKVK